MVLLTASTISAAISGVVICLFTFLLFLSGYVLQQQTVRSLQEALSAPIESRVRIQAPIPYSANLNKDILVKEDSSNDTSSDDIQTKVQRIETSQVLLSDSDLEPSPQDLWHAHINVSPSQIIKKPQSTILQDADDGRFAYVLALPTPADLCSALLFTKWQREQSLLSRQQVNIIYLYPSDWETSSHSIYTATLRLLLHSEHEYAVLLHPVPVSKVWTGIDVESQLLSELARNPWPYDRVVYLRSPGMLLDATSLDEVLVSTFADTRLLKSDWTRLRAPSRRGAPAQLHPDVLLFAQGKGLMIPVGDLQLSLTSKVTLSRAQNTGDGVDIRSHSRHAAYVLFDVDDLSIRRKDHSPGEAGIFERFERERGAVCEGTDILAM